MVVIATVTMGTQVRVVRDVVTVGTQVRVGSDGVTVGTVTLVRVVSDGAASATLVECIQLSLLLVINSFMHTPHIEELLEIYIVVPIATTMVVVVVIMIAACCKMSRHSKTTGISGLNHTDVIGAGTRDV